jgi:DNA-binding CsgD family transcriptional regulator/tetratricopeptide (TPR) repeat protein
LRVGISVGETTRADDDYFGTPIVEAARLCAAARGGQILAADVVGTLVGPRGGHRLVNLGPRTLKGLAGPLEVLEVIWSPATASPLPLPGALALAAQTTFVGRLDERQRLEVIWKAVTSGGRATVMVKGEPGIGKTRLVNEFACAAYEQGAVVLFGGCTQETLTPYQPFVEALDHWAASSSAGELARRCPKPGPLLRLLPRMTESWPSAAPRPVQPETERWQLFETIASLLQALGEDWPVVLVLDDLHWADRSSVLLLAHLARRAPQPGLLLIGTYRDTELSPDHALAEALTDLRRHQLVEQLALDGLDQAATGQLLEGLAGQATPDALGRAVHVRTEGNPFFVEEIWRHLTDTGALAGAGTDAATAAALSTPQGVRDVVVARVRRLSEEARLTLSHAAVLGQEFDFDVLVHMTGMDRGLLVAALEEGLQAQVLRAVSHPVASGFRFTHALVRGAVYDGLSHPRRQDMHRRAAEAIESLSGTTPTAAQLANHWLAAGDPPRAFTAAVQAAAQAEALFAPTEALTHFDRALELWDQVRDAPSRVHMDHAELLQRTADVAYQVGATARACALIQQALEEVAAGAEPLRRGRLYERLGRYRWMGGDTTASNAAYDHAVQLLSGYPPSVELARALGAQGQGLMLRARHIEAERCCRQAIAMARLVGALPEEGRALNTLGCSLGMLGRTDEGISYLMEARRIAEQSGSSAADLARSYVNLSAVLLYSTSRHEEAALVAVEGMALARRRGVIRSYGAMLAAYAADAFLRLGRWSEADSVTSDPALFESPPAVSMPLHLVRSALELRRGRLDVATRLLDRADRLSASMPDPHNRGYFHVRQAELAVWERRHDDARRAVEDGLAIVTGSDDDCFGPELCALGLRAEGDRSAAPGRDRLGDVAKARQVATSLLAEAHRITRRPLERGLMPSPDAAAFAVVCDAEYTRVDGCSNPERWAAAIVCWDGLGRPYHAAYARWREAEALLEGHGARTRAARTLNRAHQLAVQLGAAPLIAEIEDLAIRGRIELGVAGTEPQKPEAESPAAALGLTRREAEVLVLLATGRTNRQMAQSMFISEKTASVHVTNILRKLGVTNRVEAGAIGQRLLKEHPTETSQPTEAAQGGRVTEQSTD